MIPTRELAHRCVAAGQSVYYLSTGIWPIVDMRSFQRVTGPKADEWLVTTVGALVAVIGGGLGAAAARQEVSRDIAVVAVGAAVVLTAVDLYYVGKGRISGVYLADAVAELGLLACWAAAWPRPGAGRRFPAHSAEWLPPRPATA